jgi:peroxiredoxin
VAFFALNNPLALAELERLEALTEEFAGTGLELIAVAQSSDRPELVRTIVHAKRFLFPVAVDADASAAGAFGGVSTTPSVYLVSPDGRLRYASEGPSDQHTLRKLLSSF